MTNAIPGFGGEILISANGGTTYSRLGEVKGVELVVNSKLIDVTSLDSSGWEESIPGLNSWSASADAFYLDGNAGQEQAFSALVMRVPVLIRFYPQNQAGKNKFEGTARIENWNLSQNPEAAVAVKLSLKGTGSLDLGDI